MFLLCAKVTPALTASPTQHNTDTNTQMLFFNPSFLQVCRHRGATHRSFAHPLFLFLALIYRQSSGCTSIYMHRSAFIHLDANERGEWVTFYMPASWRLMKVDGDCGIKFVDAHAFADLSERSFIKTGSFTRTRIHQICILREFHLLTQTIFPTLMRYNLPSHVGK